VTVRAALTIACACACALQCASPIRTSRIRTAPVAQPVALESATATVSLAFTGDVIFGRYRDDGFAAICQADCASPSSLFAAVAPLLEADITVGNLETPVVRALPASAPIDTGKVFGATPAHVALLRAEGFDAMCVANNHWFDQRFEGVAQTPAVLREHGIAPLGEAVRAAPWIRVSSLDRAGLRVGFVAFTSVLNKPLVAGRPMVPFVEIDAIERRVAAVVREASRGHDLVVALAHWGEEYADAPSLAQVRAARALVDAGASLVVGHHPHVLQRIERYRGAVIAYSLGNFLFDNPALSQRETGVLRVRARRFIRR
jgi:poly-gamma-glutamate capsule biosynthesis protein CapA/YwtB (metallophosphatase superfamily)